MPEFDGLLVVVAIAFARRSCSASTAAGPASRRLEIVAAFESPYALTMELRRIGTVQSPLTDPASAPKQGHEGSPQAWIAFEARVAPALDGIREGDEIIVLTWLHRAHRDVLRVHPRGDVSNPERGVFSTRSEDRPNPVGLHRVAVVRIDGLRLLVRDLEAVDGTPVVDVKPVLTEGPEAGRAS